MALQFKRAYPAMFTAYQQACQAGQVRLGGMHLWESPDPRELRFVINFPTKYHWKSTSYIEDIEAGLVDMVRVIKEHDIRSVAVPALGCGYGGLTWSEVEPLIVAALEPLEDVDIRVYPPEMGTK